MDRLGLWLNPFLRDDVTVHWLKGCIVMAGSRPGPNRPEAETKEDGSQTLADWL